MILATLRTNYYQLDEDGNPKEYLSLKLQPELISEAPLPKPKYEMFVYSCRVEGVHLRGGKVARGDYAGRIVRRTTEPKYLA
jgi:glutamate dehydrogenase